MQGRTHENLIPEQDQAPIFKEIYLAAKERKVEKLAAIKKEHGSVDFFQDGSKLISITDKVDGHNIKIMNLTPAALCAFENDDVGVELLVQAGAQGVYPIYGYAGSGSIKKVNELLKNKEWSFIRIDFDKIYYMFFSYAGFYEQDYMSSKKNFEFLLFNITDAEARSYYIRHYFKYIKSIEVPNTEPDKQSIDEVGLLNKKINYMQTLSGKYELSYEQVRVWINLPKLHFWFLYSMHLVQDNRLPFQAIAIIGSFLAANLSVIECDVLFHPIVFDHHYRFLIQDLEQYVDKVYDPKRYHNDRATSFLAETRAVTNLKQLDELLTTQDNLLKTVESGKPQSFFDFSLFSTGKKHENPYTKKIQDNYTDIIAKHADRLRIS